MVELNKTQQRVAELAVLGLTNAAIVAQTGFPLKTVKNNLSIVYGLYDVRNRTELSVKWHKLQERTA